MKMVKLEKLFMNTQRHGEQTIKRAEKLLRLVNLEGKRNYLEVGCGNGAAARHIAGTYHLNVTGVDIDQEQIQLAQRDIGHIPNIRFFVVDGTNLPFEDSEFDIVLSFGVMHHISNWQDALGEIGRVLKPQGYFLYHDIVYPNWAARIGSSFARNYGFPTVDAIASFAARNRFSTLHSLPPKNHFMLLNEYEAVYQKQD